MSVVCHFGWLYFYGQLIIVINKTEVNGTSKMILLKASSFIKEYCVCKKKMFDEPLKEDLKWTHSGWNSFQVKRFTFICVVFHKLCLRD